MASQFNLGRLSPKKIREVVRKLPFQLRGTKTDAPHQEELERYQYDSLESNNRIRVLDLHSTAARLECSITQVDLFSAEYQALSYEWGSSETPFRIIVQDETHKAQGYIPLTANLQHALQDLRDSANIKPKRFWIDQISINQNDDIEKAHQVNAMRYIYRNASQVITYLGPHSTNMREESRAFDLLNRIDAHFRPNYVYWRTAKDMHGYSFDPSSLPIHRPSEEFTDAHPAWPALLRIVLSGWLRRLWMQQENVLCSRTIMLRGKLKLDWMSVASIPILFSLELLPGPVLQRESTVSGTDPYTIVNSMHTSWEARWHHVYGDGGDFQFRNLARNLHFSENLECKIPRDRIFAVLGISSDADDLGIFPDYRQPLSQLYAHVSARIYQTSQNLYLLDVVISGTQIPSDSYLPSWAFNGSPKTEMELETNRPHPETSYSFRFEEEDRIMVAKGRCIDKIRFVTEHRDFVTDVWSDEEKRIIHTFKQTLQIIIVALDEVGYSFESLNSLIRAVVANSTWAESDTLIETAFSVWCLCRLLAVWLDKLTSSSIKNEPPWCYTIPSLLQQLQNVLSNGGKNVQNNPWSELTEEEDRIGRAMYRRTTNMGGRSISISEKNRICNTTAQARKGDIIALLAGGRLSYVLRHVGNGYQYIGTAYVHDFTDAAAYTDTSPEEVDEEVRLV
jgi:hypothetical protein